MKSQLDRSVLIIGGAGEFGRFLRQDIWWIQLEVQL